MAKDRLRNTPSLVEATRVWAKIGLLSFGGPAGQIALMHKELVESRHWIDERRFLHALNYCMLLPGPEAQQLAIYIGWLLHRTIGGLIAGLLFILPGALTMLGLSMLYVSYRQLPLVDAAFLGIKAAVLAIVLQATIRIGRRTLTGPAMTAIAAAAFVGIYVFKLPFPLIVFLAGLAGWVGHRLAPGAFSGATGHNGAGETAGKSVVDAMEVRGQLAHARPSRARFLRTALTGLALWLAPVGLLSIAAAPASVWTDIAHFFSTMAIVTFGGAYAVLAYVAQEAVTGFGWLRPGEMLDGLGLAETTPGPLILVLQFVGFLAAYRAPGQLDPMLAGTLGAALTLWVTFVPSFLLVFLGGPYVETLRGNRALSAALGAITAAIVGVILNLAVWFALHTIFRQVAPVELFGLRPELPVLSSVDWRAALLATGALLAVFRFGSGVASTITASALAGVLLVSLAPA